ncbi:MAG: hypothetical protein U9O65_08000 [Thermotogota bacterium]|nr:hypothetical protein [Thermotogota bacterium]
MPMDIPQVNYGLQTDYKRLYYSEPEAALKVPVTIMPGYGKLEQGTALALNGSAGGQKAKVFPYDPAAAPDGKAVRPAAAFLVTDSGTSSNILYTTLDDSYKFEVGDDIYIEDDTTTAENLGAITAIDRTTYTNRAAITVTNVTGSTSFTTARFAYIAVEGYDTCVGILEKTVDTGTGSSAKGALSTMILGNCVLYNGMLTNFDSAAITDLSAGSYGQYVYIR